MRTLLLADDSITVQRVIGLTFAAEDFEIVTVSDGQAAIDRLKTRPPDIVLASSAMPNVSGYDVARFARSEPGLKSLPVLLLTGAFESVDLERLKTSGVTGVLEKPLDPIVVISRVKELLGIKGDAPAAPAPAPARPGTPAKPPAPRKPPVPREAPVSSQALRSEPPAVRSSKPAPSDQTREAPGPSPDAPSAEGAGGSGADYLDTLDAAFDSLDQKLDGREEPPRYTGPERRARPERHNRDRNPAPPLAHQGTVVDRRSPGRRPSPLPPPPAPHEVPPAAAVFEVDDEWFADDNKGQEERLAEQNVLAAEMGLRDMEIRDESGAVEAAPNASAPNADLDFEFGPDGEPKPAPPPPPESQVADDFAALLAFEQGEQPHPPAPLAPVIVPAAPEITDEMLDQIAGRVAAPEITDEMLDRIAGRVAAPEITDEMLDRIAGRVAAPEITDEMLDRIAGRVAAPEITGEMLDRIAGRVAAPEITGEMLDQVAERVATRLNAGSLGEHLRAEITATVRETVLAVVSETAERLVRDEIARIKAQAERETH